MSKTWEVLARPGALLIDDYAKNCMAFRRAGGVALMIGRPWNAAAAFESRNVALVEGFIADCLNS